MPKDDEKELDRAYKVGQSSGLEMASGYLLEESLDFFKAGKDKEASLLRAISAELKKRSLAQHPGAPIS